MNKDEGTSPEDHSPVDIWCTADVFLLVKYLPQDLARVGAACSHAANGSSATTGPMGGGAEKGSWERSSASPHSLPPPLKMRHVNKLMAILC